MRIITQAIATLVVAMVIAAAGYFYLERDYVKKSHIAQIAESLDSLGSELSNIKSSLLEQQSNDLMESHKTAERLESLRKDIIEIKENFLRMEGSKKTEIETTSKAVASWQERNRQALSALQTDLKEIKDNYLSKNAAKNFHSVNLELGPLPSGKPGSLSYRLPAEIPDSAQEILVYAYIATDLAKGGAHNFKIAVKTDGDSEAAFYLYANPDTRPGWSYNSDNMWLPMPTDRELRIYTEETPLYGNWTSAVKIIAYR